MSSREAFEAWMTAEQWFHGSDFEWDVRRNCYSQFGIHLAYKAWLAATSAMEEKYAALAAECASTQAYLRNGPVINKGGELLAAHQFAPATAATDAFLDEVREHARSEGINYAASRLAAAFNHGFVDKPVKEVADVVRMILTAKEDLANDALPAPDALSGEYAEQALDEWATELRQGGAQSTTDEIPLPVERELLMALRKGGAA